MKASETEACGVAGLVSLAVWRKKVGISAPTAWRWVKRGWLRTVQIGGRPYLTAESEGEFLKRASSGEFEKIERLSLDPEPPACHAKPGESCEWQECPWNGTDPDCPLAVAHEEWMKGKQ